MFICVGEDETSYSEVQQSPPPYTLVQVGADISTSLVDLWGGDETAGTLEVIDELMVGAKLGRSNGSLIGKLDAVHSV